jgi:hypothetical protein
MKTVEVQLPDSIRLQLEEMAKLEGISLNQMLVTAASNEIIRQETRGFFNQISRNYSPQDFANALAAVPDVPPVDGD